MGRETEREAAERRVRECGERIERQREALAAFERAGNHVMALEAQVLLEELATAQVAHIAELERIISNT